ncbi:MAG: hypothetical protein R3B90_03650 [Planctomycetaceae bacterium]
MFTIDPGNQPLLGDGSVLFKLPPADDPGDGLAASAPATSSGTAAPPPDPRQAKREYEEGLAWLNKPVVPGAGWPAADRAVQHFTEAARLDPTNSDYAMQAGIACRQSIRHFLLSWGEGPLTSIAAFHRHEPLGEAIHQSQGLFRPTALSEANSAMLRARAQAGIDWFSRALRIAPGDSVTLCHRAELLRDIGAFGPALADAAASLQSPLVPTATRALAQEVTDFILGEDSALRPFLTRSETRQLAAPIGIELPKTLTVPAASAPLAPNLTAAQTVGNEFGFLSHEAGPAGPVLDPALVPTINEIPLVTSASARDRRQPRTPRVRNKQATNWLTIAIPVVLAIVLLGGGVAYVFMTRTTFTGDLVGNDVGGETVKKTLYRTEFDVPEDRLDPVLIGFRDDPKYLETGLRTIQLRGDVQGLTSSLRAGPKGRVVRVDVRSNVPLALFARESAAELETPRRTAVSERLKRFVHDYHEARGSGMEMGNIDAYLDTLAGDALVGGLGYHLIGRAEDVQFPCVYEDANGSVYFLVPRSVEKFTVVERAFDGVESVFPTKLEFQVTIAAPAIDAASEGTAPEANPDDATTAPDDTGESMDGEADDESMDATPDGEPQPMGFGEILRMNTGSN